MEGYVAKEQWANAGLGMPEATAQTLFWAMREENLAQFAECVPPRLKEDVLRLLVPGAEPERADAIEEWRRMTKANGFRIALRHVETEDKVTLGIQFVAGAGVVQMRFRRYGNEWKWEGF